MYHSNRTSLVSTLSLCICWKPCQTLNRLGFCIVYCLFCVWALQATCPCPSHYSLVLMTWSVSKPVLRLISALGSLTYMEGLLFFSVLFRPPVGKAYLFDTGPLSKALRPLARHFPVTRWGAKVQKASIVDPIAFELPLFRMKATYQKSLKRLGS